MRKKGTLTRNINKALKVTEQESKFIDTVCKLNNGSTIVKTVLQALELFKTELEKEQGQYDTK